jgi:hypothetical protein
LESDLRNPKKAHKRKHGAEKKNKTFQAQPLEEKKQRYTVMLFGTRAHKEGAVAMVGE